MFDFAWQIVFITLTLYVYIIINVCVYVYYEGPLQISAIALNGIPSGNKIYLI